MNTFLDSRVGKAGRPSAQGPPNPSGCILLVEDDSILCRLSAEALVRSGFQVDTAEDGEAGWEALHGHGYDLLITDNNMPRLSGIELVKKLRSAEMTLPVIIASGTLNTDELKRHERLGFAATLLKPFTTDQLLAIVNEVLRPTGSVRVRNPFGGSALAESFRQIEPVLRWGINE